jgi:hypothetical protein
VFVVEVERQDTCALASTLLAGVVDVGFVVMYTLQRGGA